MATNSNGFDIDRIFPALRGRLGWHQPTYAGAPVLDADNLEATSGRYYDRGFHKLVTVKNYYESQEEEGITDAEFNQLLEDEDKAAIMRCLNAIFNKPALIDSQSDYTRTTYLQNVIIPNGGNFCGRRVNVAFGDYSVEIDRISLLFNGAGTFNLYLFNDLLLTPVATKSVTTVANTQTIVDTKWKLTQVDASNIGGVWYVGYSQDDLAALGINAIDEQMRIWNTGIVYGSLPFQSPLVSTGGFFNRTNASINFQTYGMNLTFTSYRDYTQSIIDEAPFFDEARGLIMAVGVLEQLKYSTRSNAVERIAGERANRIDTDMNISSGNNNQYPNAAGLKQQIEREFIRLNENFWPKAKAQTLTIGDGGCYREYQGVNVNLLPARNLPR